MKTNTSNSSKGSVLLSAAMTAGVLAILIAGFLTYMSNEYNLNIRSHRWNQAFHLAESSAEIGIAEFNYQYSQGSSGFQSGSGWTSLGGGSYSKTVSNLTDTSGNVIGTLAVTASGIGTSNPKFQGVGTVTSSNYGGQSIARAVQVTLAGNSSLFPYGIISKSPLDFGGGIFTDSYDSSDPTKSTNGLYDSAKKQANGDIATTSTLSNAGSLHNGADINGKIATGPGGSVTMSGGATMGPTFSGQATLTSQGEANGWITHAFTSSPTDASLPSALSSASNYRNDQPQQLRHPDHQRRRLEGQFSEHRRQQ
jgi:hypothetical protein